MAIRYSGDCEIRIEHRDGKFIGSVRAPNFRQPFVASRRISLAILKIDKNNLTKAYDKIALGALRACLRANPLLPVDEIHGRPTVSRLFKSPCPVGR
jgi:hypothetical protein